MASQIEITPQESGITDPVDFTSENKLTLEEPTRKSFRNYIFLYLTQFLSMIGSQIVSFAIGWWLTIETGSSFILSMATLANMVPMIIISPFAGVIADRYSKKKIMLLTDGGQALATLVLIGLFYFDLAQLWHIMALMSVRGICQGFQMPVGSSLTALMVPKEKINKINSVAQIFQSVLSISSPALGALSVAYFTIDQVYWLDVITFIPGAIFLLFITIPHDKNGKDSAEQNSFKDDFTEGFRYIGSNGLLPAFILFAVANFFLVPLFSLLPLLVNGYHGGTAQQYGITEMGFHIGMILGAVALMASKIKPTMKGVVISGLLLGVAMILLGSVPQGNLWLLYGATALLGVLLPWIDTQLMSVLQTTIPKEIQGRVFSTMFTLIKSIMPLGLVLWGWLGDITGVMALFIITPSITLVIYVVLVKFTKVLQYGQ